MNKWIKMCKVSSKNVRLGHICKMQDLTQLLPHPTPLIFSPTLWEWSPTWGLTHCKAQDKCYNKPNIHRSEGDRSKRQVIPSKLTY